MSSPRVRNENKNKIAKVPLSYPNRWKSRPSHPEVVADVSRLAYPTSGRKSSLIAQDNDLFRQLLSLHDSIAELRERQRHSVYMDDDDDEEEDDIDITECPGHRNRHNSPSLESLSDPGELPETSPESTLSSRSSLSANSSDFKPRKHHNPCSSHRNRYRKDDGKQRHRASSNTKDDSRPLIFIDKSEICFRCRKMAPPYRRSSSITSLYYLHEDMESYSYDSGIHLQGSHSDSDHEIFV
ncbi:uncharacterized protein TNCT_653631 [Trichonephila clavata]|uniref:Uncharacterized protein n=1 Tax=Trichonephila clavata TaxID=2740835 RepID=A0A8X6EWA6_TRICU|nr:uncharacterized protein TNCT_653631 [Trichonephila clavata]